MSTPPVATTGAHLEDQPLQDRRERPMAAPLARDSMAAALGTMVSRGTGLVRIVVVAAVLGPTYLGNTFQALNYTPNRVYELLSGSLFASLLVPALVRHLDRHDVRAAERLAGGFLGLTGGAFGLVAIATVASGPLLLSILSAGVDDPAVREAQRRVGWLLLALLMPQVVLYGVAGVGCAAANARGRFVLAAAAPAVENVGVIVTMLLSARRYGSGTPIGEVRTPQLLLLGLGPTVAVGCHAALQWWGARRAGIRLLPRAGWRDPEAGHLLRMAVPSLGYASLSAVSLFSMVVVANRVPGGVMAFQMAFSFFHLPVAIAARPVAVAALRRLARLHHRGDACGFRDELVRALALIAFVAVPASVAYVVLAGPLARAAAYGEMASPAGVSLVAAALASLGPGLMGCSALLLATNAAYARGDARTPLAAMLTGTGVSLIGMAVAYRLAPGAASLVVLGLAVSTGYTVGACHLGVRLRAALPRGDERLAPALLRAAAASVVMIGPAHLVADRFTAEPGAGVLRLLTLLAAVVVGVALFLGVQGRCRSPELSSLRAGLSRRTGEGDAPPTGSPVTR
jgi:putative peptidoglycan lipid II flippase